MNNALTAKHITNFLFMLTLTCCHSLKLEEYRRLH